MLNVVVRSIWLRHLLPHQSPRLNQLIWLASQLSPSFLSALCASLPKLGTALKRKTFPNRRGPFPSQGDTIAVFS